MRTYRASSLGSCTRAQTALHLGYVAQGTSDHMQALYDRGNTHEDECVAAMQAAGWNVYDQQLEVTGLISDQARVVGHLDGKVHPSIEQPRMLEIKSPISWAKFEKAYKMGDWSDPLMNRYAWQTSMCMVATDMECVVACLDDGVVKTFTIEVPVYDQEAIEERVLDMEAQVIANWLPPVCSQADFPCPVSYLHEAPEATVDPALDVLVNEREIARTEAQEADKRVKAYTAKIDAHLTKADTESIETAWSKATRFTTTRKTLDKAGLDGYLKGHGTELADFETESTSTSIRVTAKTPDEEIDL